MSACSAGCALRLKPEGPFIFGETLVKIGWSVFHYTMILLLALHVNVRADPGNAGSDWAVLQALDAGEKLFVKLADDRKVSGTLVSASENILVLSVGNRTADYSRQEVSEIRLGRGRSLKKPILLGAIIGAGGGAGLGGAAAAGDNGEFLDVKAHQGIPVGAAVGAVVGTAVGAVVGLLRGQGELIYRAP